MRRIATITLVVAVGISSGVALAGPAKRGVYIGGSVGQSYFELDTNTPITFDDEDFAYKIIAGYRAANFFAVEGGFRDLGKVQDSDGNVVVTTETQAFDAEGVGILKIGIFDLFGKVGAVYWNTDVEFPDTPGNNFDDDDFSAIYGVGAAVRLGALGIRLEYEVIDTKVPDDLEMLSVGVTWTF